MSIPMSDSDDDLTKIMVEDITKKIESANFVFVKIDTFSELTKIYNLWCCDIFSEPCTPVEYLYFGSYYENLDNDDKMLEYKTLSSEGGCIHATIDLGRYYLKVKKDFEKGKHYYTLAFENGSAEAAYNLGFHHQFDEIDIPLMKKYYYVAIQGGLKNASQYLGKHYYDIKICKSLYYYSRGESLKGINIVLDTIIRKKSNLDKYFYKSLPLLKALQENNTTIKYPPLIQSIMDLFVNKINVMEMAFEYMPENDGCKKAKEEFVYLCSLPR